MRLAKNQNQTVKVGQWVLFRFQWYIVESIDGETGELYLIGDDGESTHCMPSSLDGLGELTKGG